MTSKTKELRIGRYQIKQTLNKNKKIGIENKYGKTNKTKKREQDRNLV